MNESKTDEVVEIIRERIENGVYVSGQRLPPERELADEFGVSRPTIRAAYQRLQSQNLLDIVPRGGAYIRSYTRKVTVGSGDPSQLPTAKGRELAKTGSFIRAMKSEGKEVKVRMLQPSEIIPAGELIAQNMDITPDVKVLRRYRTQVIDRVPYRLLDSYYLSEFLDERFLPYDHQYYPVFKWLRENQGIQAHRAFEKLNCRMPTEEEAAILHISRNQAVVEMDRWVWAVYVGNPEEVLFEYTKMIANAALHDFTYTYDISKEASQ